MPPITDWSLPIGTQRAMGVNSAELFSRLNPYFISVDSLTLFPDTEPYRMEKEGKFIPAGEKERLQELQHIMDTVSEEEMAKYRRILKALG